MNFSNALNAIKNGSRVARSGWSGRHMWVALSPGFELPPDRIFSDPIRADVAVSGQDGMFRPYLMLKTTDGEFVPWVASQSDLLSDDWYVA